MKRRSFLKVLAGAALAVAALAFEFSREPAFDPIKYKGDFHWLHAHRHRWSFDPNPPRFKIEDGKWVGLSGVTPDGKYFEEAWLNPDWFDAPREEKFWYVDIPVIERI